MVTTFSEISAVKIDNLNMHYSKGFEKEDFNQTVEKKVESFWCTLFIHLITVISYHFYAKCSKNNWICFWKYMERKEERAFVVFLVSSWRIKEMASHGVSAEYFLPHLSARRQRIKKGMNHGTWVAQSVSICLQHIYVKSYSISLSLTNFT